MFISGIRELQGFDFTGIVLSGHFNSSEYDDDLFTAYGIELPVSFSSKNIAIKRKAEILASRILVKKVLLQLACPTWTITHDENRCPIWPNGYAGSISHSHNRVLVAASKCNALYDRIAGTGSIGGIGIDVESIIELGAVPAIKSQVCTTSELALLSRFHTEEHRALTVLFSAKESIFKALYLNVKRYFDFSAAKLIGVAQLGNVLYFQLTEKLSINLLKGALLQVQVEQHHSYIITFMRQPAFQSDELAMIS